MKYEDQVGAKEAAKRQAEHDREARDRYEIKMRYDKEMEFIEMQKNNAKQLNYQQLDMQKQEKNYIDKLNDPK